MRIGLDYIVSQLEKFAKAHPYLNSFHEGEPEEILDGANYPVMVVRVNSMNPDGQATMRSKFDVLVLDEKIEGTSEAKLLSDTGFVFTELLSTFKLDNEENFGFYIKTLSNMKVSKDPTEANLGGWYGLVDILVHNYETDFQSAMNAVELEEAITVVRPISTYTPEELLAELTEYQLNGVQLFSDMSEYSIDELFAGLTFEQIQALQLFRKSTSQEAIDAVLDNVEFLTPLSGKVSVIEHAQDAKYIDANANEITIQQALHNLKIAIDEANDERVDVLLENAPTEVDTLLKIYNLINANDLAVNNTISNVQSTQNTVNINVNNSISNIQLALNSPDSTLDDLAEIVLFIQTNRIDLDNYILSLQNKVDKIQGSSLASDAEKALWNDKYTQLEIDDKLANFSTGEQVLEESVGVGSVSSKIIKGTGQITLSNGSATLTGFDADLANYYTLYIVHFNSRKTINISTIVDSNNATIQSYTDEDGTQSLDGIWSDTTATFDYYYSSNFAIGNNSWAIGVNNITKYDYSFAFGEGNRSKDDHSFSFGYNNIAGDNHAFAFGDGNRANYDHSICWGEDNIVNRAYSVAYGYSNLIDNAYGFSQGSYNEIYQDYGFAMGRDNILNGYIAFAFGDNNTVNSRGSAILGGEYNTISVDSDYSGIGGGTNITVPSNKSNTWFSHILSVGGGKVGTPKIEFWNDLTENILQWSTTVNRTISLPDQDGVIAIKDNIIIDNQDISGDVVIDLANKDVFHLTLIGNVTSIDVINFVVGKTYKIYFIQDVVGNRTISGFNEKFKTENNISILLTNDAESIDLLQFDIFSSLRINIYPIYNI